MRGCLLPARRVDRGRCEQSGHNAQLDMASAARRPRGAASLIASSPSTERYSVKGQPPHDPLLYSVEQLLALTIALLTDTRYAPLLN